MENTRQPNLNVVGAIGWCLSTQADVWGTPHGVYDWAWYAWLGAKYKHLDRSFPTDAAVLVWFTYRGTQGHVVTHVPGKGFLSSPWQKGTQRAWLSSIEEIESIYSSGGKYPLTYLGWSEDVNNVRVAQPQKEDMATLLDRATITNLAVKLLNRQPTAEELDAQDGKPLIELYRAWSSSENPERKNIETLLDLGIQANAAHWQPGQTSSDADKKLKQIKEIVG